MSVSVPCFNWRSLVGRGLANRAAFSRLLTLISFISGVTPLYYFYLGWGVIRGVANRRSFKRSMKGALIGVCKSSESLSVEKEYLRHIMGDWLGGGTKTFITFWFGLSLVNLWKADFSPEPKSCLEGYWFLTGDYAVP